MQITDWLQVVISGVGIIIMLGLQFGMQKKIEGQTEARLRSADEKFVSMNNVQDKILDDCHEEAKEIRKLDTRVTHVEDICSAQDGRICKLEDSK